MHRIVTTPHLNTGYSVSGVSHITSTCTNPQRHKLCW